MPEYYSNARSGGGGPQSKTNAWVVVVSLTTASFVARKTSARVGLRWCHLLWKSVCFSMCAGNTYWCHFSAKSFAISTNGLVQNDSGRASALRRRACHHELATTDRGSCRSICLNTLSNSVLLESHSS